MAWETRKNGGRYYTRSRREGGRVVREYFGSGEIGAAVAFFDQKEREKKHEETERLKRFQRECEELDSAVEEFCEETETLYRAVLIACGYRQHDRGEWRKRRG